MTTLLTNIERFVKFIGAVAFGVSTREVHTIVDSAKHGDHAPSHSALEQVSHVSQEVVFAITEKMLLEKENPDMEEIKDDNTDEIREKLKKNEATNKISDIAHAIFDEQFNEIKTASSDVETHTDNNENEIDEMEEGQTHESEIIGSQRVAQGPATLAI